MAMLAFVSSLAASALTATSFPALTNLVLRAGLSGMCLVSGLGKLADMPGTRQAMGDFGVPAWAVRPASLALPCLEVALAGALLIDPLCTFASWGLALLMLTFAAGLANLLRQDRRPPCHCFGAVHSAPVGLATVLRALGLACAAAVSASLPVYPLSHHPGMTLAGFVGVLFGTGMVIRRKKHLGADATRLMVGQRLPAARLTSGQWLQDLLPGEGLAVLIILSHRCSACRDLVKELPAWTSALDQRLPLIPVHLDDGPEQPALEGRQFALLRSPTPSAILVSADGALRHPPVNGAEQIEALIRVALRGDHHTVRP